MSPSTHSLQARAEILKLARILERDLEQLSYLETVPIADLRALRDQVTEVLWSANGGAMKRLAAASKLLPAALSATIAERAFGPLLTARLAAQLEPARAVDVAAKLPTAFLADVAIELDPRRAREVIAGIPPPRVAEITRELVRREEYVTVGRFVGYISDDATRAALGAMDEVALLRIGFVLEDTRSLDHLLDLLPADRMDGLIQTAAENGLWVEALDLLGQLSAKRRRKIVSNALELDQSALEDVVAAVIEHELWPQVLLIAERDVNLQRELAERLPALPFDQQRAIAKQAKRDDVVAQLGVLGEALAQV
jgi:hypothetical protein